MKRKESVTIIENWSTSNISMKFFLFRRVRVWFSLNFVFNCIPVTYCLRERFLQILRHFLFFLQSFFSFFVLYISSLKFSHHLFYFLFFRLLNTLAISPIIPLSLLQLSSLFVSLQLINVLFSFYCSFLILFCLLFFTFSLLFRICTISSFYNNISLSFVLYQYFLHFFLSIFLSFCPCFIRSVILSLALCQYICFSFSLSLILCQYFLCFRFISIFLSF